MFTPTEIRYRPDGSIDTEHFMKKGRLARSETAHRMVKTLAKPEKPAARISGFWWPMTKKPV